MTPVLEPVKVLHVSPSFFPAHGYGGTIQSGYHLCRALLDEPSCDIRVLTTDSNGIGRRLDVARVGEVIVEGGLRVRYCHKIARNSVSPELLVELCDYIKWADVVHLTAVYNFPTIPTLAMCRGLGRPVVWSPRGALQRWEGSTRPLLKRLWERTCRAVAPRSLVLHVTSEDEARESLLRIPGATVAVVPNGVEIPSPGPRKDRAQVFRLLYLGRLHPKKGIENLLHACRMFLDRSEREWTLTIAGSGEPGYTQSISQLVAKLRLDSQVVMTGEVVGDAKEAVFNDADVVVVPSHTENFGIVVAEALSHGIPVIASKGTPWSKVEQVGCGLWVENSAEGLALAIERMRALPLYELGARGRAWMEAEFTWEARATEMRDVYAGLIGTT